MQYQFGDTDIAAHRLKVVNDVFAESTRPFILDTVTNVPHLAIDMGCGPGFTTHFLAELLQCDRIVGLDNSEHFISLARKTETQRVSFNLHDVTTVPFPAEPCDLLYCRFLLSHLQNPAALVATWVTQLRPKGLLLMEEVDWIRTENEVLVVYLDIVDAMLKHQSQELYVGRVVNRIEDTDTLKRKSSKLMHLPVTARDAAGMFYLNIQSWRHQPYVRENYSSSMINQLEADLKVFSEAKSDETEIEWGLRQIVFERK